MVLALTMADRYAKFQKTATRLIGKWKQGRVTVVRYVDGDPRPPDHPTWEPWPDNSRREVYELDAVVKGVSAKLIDGTTVIASDRELTCSHKMTLVETIVGDDAPVFSNTPVPFDAGLLDTLSVDGKPVTIMRDLTVPGAGVPVAHRFVIR